MSTRIFQVIFNRHECFGLAVQRLSALFIHLFINLISSFYELLNYFTFTFKRFQVFLFNISNSINKYSYLIRIICTQQYGFKQLIIIIPSKRWNSSIWPIDETLTDTTNLIQNEAESNGYKVVLHIPQTRLEPHHQMQFNVISKTRLLSGK